MQSFIDLLHWYKNKNARSTFDVEQKIVEFYHKKGTGELKLGCTLGNVANICLHSSISAKFPLFKEIE